MSIAPRFLAAKAVREGRGCRSKCRGTHLAGSSENIRSVVAKKLRRAIRGILSRRRAVRRLIFCVGWSFIVGDKRTAFFLSFGENSPSLRCRKTKKPRRRKLRHRQFCFLAPCDEPIFKRTSSVKNSPSLRIFGAFNEKTFREKNKQKGNYIKRGR